MSAFFFVVPRGIISVGRMARPPSAHPVAGVLATRNLFVMNYARALHALFVAEGSSVRRRIQGRLADTHRIDSWEILQEPPHVTGDIPPILPPGRFRGAELAYEWTLNCPGKPPAAGFQCRGEMAGLLSTRKGASSRFLAGARVLAGPDGSQSPRLNFDQFFPPLETGGPFVFETNRFGVACANGRGQMPVVDIVGSPLRSTCGALFQNRFGLIRTSVSPGRMDLEMRAWILGIRPQAAPLLEYIRDASLLHALRLALGSLPALQPPPPASCPLRVLAGHWVIVREIRRRFPRGALQLASATASYVAEDLSDLADKSPFSLITCPRNEGFFNGGSY